jgi:uncharacterized protein YbbC (DUF1343 family)
MKTPTRWFLIALSLTLFARVEVEADPAASNVARPPTATGIDVLVRDGFTSLEGRRVGLITNHTGLDRSGVSTIRRLHEAPDVELAALFSPEHGLHGKLDVPEIADSEDAGTGIRVYSLYGNIFPPSDWPWRPRRNGASDSWYSTGQIRSTASTCPARWRIRDGNRLPRFTACRCATA